MKKNNKGFTLVELIAVVALLGILVLFAVPRIYSLVVDSRKSVYIEDAIRLITQAQYAMNSKSVKIEKPEDGECIVISMKYLNSGDFQNPPNGGSYLPESSFVIVKNEGGEYIYSAMLVERMKDGGLFGVELSTESALNAKNAIIHVRAFRDDEIAFITDDGGIDSGFINDSINRSDDEDDGDYVDDDDAIIGFYNDEKDEDELIVDTSVPKFSAKFNSTGTLQTILNISASDADNLKSELLVCLKFSDNSNDTYPDPTDATERATYCEAYGDGNFYTKQIDFSRPEFGGYSYSSDETRKAAYVYIAVADPNNNVTRKKLTYGIRENEAPKIAVFRIDHHPDDAHNMPRSRVTLSLSDDMDNQENLQVCFLQDDVYGTCEDYKPYSYYFGPTNIFDYTFKDSNGLGITYPDGTRHTMTVFVKDSMGEVVKDTTSYRIYENHVPTVTVNSLTGDCLFKKADGTCNCTNCNSLTYTVDLTIADDITPADDVRITLYEKNANGDRYGELSMTYGQFLNGDKKYTFSGDYDGNFRQLYVDAIDEYGGLGTGNKRADKVYLDKPPAITAKKDENGNDLPYIQSAMDPCTGADTCFDRNNGGSYDVILNFNATDDLTDVSGIKICLSEDEDVCTEANLNTSNFMNYSELNPRFSFHYTGDDSSQPYPSPQITKKLYVAIADDKGHVKDYPNGWSYKLYENQGPTISGELGVASTDPDRFIMTVRFNLDNITVSDDFDDFQARLCYIVAYGGQNNVTVCDEYYNYAELVNELTDSYEFKDSDGNPLRYNVNSIRSRIEIKDNYGATASTNLKQYVPFKDTSPTISSQSVASSGSGFNSYIIKVKFKVTDPYDTYQACVTNDNTCADADFRVNSDGYPFVAGTSAADATEYEITVDGHDVLGWPDNYQDNGQERSFNLIVKDSYGNTAMKSLKYTLYELCSDDQNGNLTPTADPPELIYDENYPDNHEITTNYCQGECYRHYETTTTTTHVNYLSKDNDDAFGYYKKTLQYLDNHVNLTCPIGSSQKLYCNSAACFDTFVDGGADENPNLISMSLQEENFEWFYTNEKVMRRIPIDKPYCRNLGSSDYFYSGDIRCTTPNFCDNKATTYCIPFVQEAVEAYNTAREEIDAEYARMEAIYAFEEEEALRQYLVSVFVIPAGGDDETPSPSPTASAEIPVDCTKTPKVCDCRNDPTSHDDCETVLSCVAFSNENALNLHPECVCILDPDNPVCACESDPDGEVCSCLEDPSGAGCACLLYPDSATCACEQDPEGEKCLCAQDLTRPGCLCVMNPDSEACLCEQDPSRPGCTCILDPDDPSCETPPEEEEIIYPEGFDVIEAINTCSSILLHMNDSMWLATHRDQRCGGYNTCLQCMGEHPPTTIGTCDLYNGLEDIGQCMQYLQDPDSESYICSAFDANSTMYFMVGENDYRGMCDTLEMYIADYRETFIANYESTHPYPQKPPYPDFNQDDVLNSCKAEYNTRCEAFYDFCDDEFTSYKKVVSCTEHPEIDPTYCRVGETEIEDGYCLTSDDSCISIVEGIPILDEDHCQAVCYQDYDCTETYEEKPVVFTCHGYFNTYRASLYQGDIKLEKQERVICPDFLRLYPQFFAYNNESDTPFIKFNPAEVGE